jgi:hypothetical protein
MESLPQEYVIHMYIGFTAVGVLEEYLSDVVLSSAPPQEPQSGVRKRRSDHSFVFRA